MRAARLTAARELEIADVEDPRPGSHDQIAIRVRGAGVCGTDLHFVQGLLDPGGFPRILGHEIAGVVAEDGGGFRSGDKVAVYNVLFCGECSHCLSGRQRLCTRSCGMFGFNADGGFAEYLVAPAKNLVIVPDSVSFESAAVLACSGMSAVHAVRLSGIGLGDVVLVNGIGGVGLMVIQVAKAAGAQVIAVGDRSDKLNLAGAVGADDMILITESDEYSGLKKTLSGIGVQPGAFFETVGTKESMLAGFDALAPGGSFVQIGYTSDRLDIHPSALIKNELRLITSAAGSLADLETAIKLAASGAIEASINRCEGLEAIPGALDAIRRRTILGRSVIALDRL